MYFLYFCILVSIIFKELVMKKLFSLLIGFFLTGALAAQPLDETLYEGQSCTSIMVGKKASKDGSVITSHTCDGRYRTWVSVEPAKDWPEGSMHQVYKGSMHTASRSDRNGMTLAGEIPQAAHTFAD